jgi:hypothetical protein
MLPIFVVSVLSYYEYLGSVFLPTGPMLYLRYLCLFAHSGVLHILCCVFGFFLLCLWFLPLVYPMLPVSLDCPFLIIPSVFSNVYLIVLIAL